MTSSPWWDSDRHRDRRPYLLARNAIQAAIRSWFVEQGFIEVDPTILQTSPGNELHLHAFKTDRFSTDGSKQDQLYLHTSPEFAMKKLIAAGEQKIVTFTHAFRNREAGKTHSSEFIMLEWYRTEGSLEDLMADCEAILGLSLSAVQSDRFTHKTHAATLRDPQRLSVVEAFNEFAGLDLLASLTDPKQPDSEILRQQTSLRTAIDDSWSDIFTRILVEQIEPNLPADRLVFLHDYPKPEAALARTHPNDHRLARRFELYACGVEVANAFEELTDPVEQRARFEVDMAARQLIYGERYPLDEQLLAALPHMPPTAGIALGFDRLVMLATGAERIEQVMWTPVGG